jgi:putative transposase
LVIAWPDTILAWYRKLVARKISRSQARQGPGRREVEQLIIRMASENRDWGCDRIAGAMANLGYVIPIRWLAATERPATRAGAQAHDPWSVLIRTDLALLAGTDFFTAEVLTLRSLVSAYVVFFIHLESRRVDIAGITVHPDEPWMKQIARNVTMEGRCGLSLSSVRSRHQIYPVIPCHHCVRSSGTACAAGARPEVSAYLERWLRSVKEEVQGASHR